MSDKEKPAQKEQTMYQALLRRRHPAYEDNVEHWGFLWACYKGERTWFKDNIHRYHKEGKTNFEGRLKRAYRFNHSREVVDLVNKYLFRGKVERNLEDSPDCLVKFWEDCTGKNVDITQFARQISTYTSIVGRTWVVVDTNVNLENVRSKQDEEDQDARVFAYPVLPTDVLDMSYDDKKVLNWIMIREHYREDENPFQTAQKASMDFRYRLWTRDGWFLYQAKEISAEGEGTQTRIELIKQGKHNLGMVPVTWCDHMESDELYSTPSLLSDIAYLDRAVANYLSNLDVIIQDQTFSQMVMPAQGLLPGSDDYKAMLDAGTKQILIYDGESNTPPSFISPDATQAQVLLDTIFKIINEIYHTVGMAGERTKQDNAVGIDNSSGVAKAYDFERVNAMLVSKADSLDRFEKRLAKLVCAYNSDELKDEDKDLVKYPEDFDIRGLSDEFDIASNLMILSLPDELRREHGKVVIDKLWPRASEEQLATLYKSLENWPEDPVALAGRMADAVAQPQDNAGEDDKAPAAKTQDKDIKQPSRQGQAKD